MCDAIPSNTMTKREFLRASGFGLCGLAVGGAHWNSLIRPNPIPVTMRISGDVPDTWSKEALYWEWAGDAIRCLKCPNGCVLGPNESGICRNRVHDRGKLYSIAYGNPCAVHIDPIEKKPLFHFLPSTRAFSIAAAGCSLRCLNCQNYQISQVSPRETQNYDLMPNAVVAKCISDGCESIAYTYSEPTSFYEYTLDTALIARKRNVKNVLKSNGFLNELPMRNLAKHLDAANIDLKSFDSDTYKRLSQGSLEPILKSLTVLREEGVWLEITNLLIPGWTDDLDTISRMCEWLCAKGFADAPLHFTRFIPLYKLTQLPTTPVSTLENARATAMKAGMKYVYIGNVPGHEAENTFCPKCGKIIVERRGFVVQQNGVREGHCVHCRERIPGIWHQ